MPLPLTILSIICTINLHSTKEQPCPLYFLFFFILYLIQILVARFPIYSKALSLLKVHISVLMIKFMLFSQEWCWIPPISLLRKKLRQKYPKFEADVGYINELKTNLGYVMKAYLKDAGLICSSGAPHLLTHMKV